jgi:hypothetical protein
MHMHMYVAHHVFCIRLIPLKVPVWHLLALHSLVAWCVWHPTRPTSALECCHGLDISREEGASGSQLPAVVIWHWQCLCAEHMHHVSWTM